MTFTIEDRHLQNYLAALQKTKKNHQTSSKTINEALALDFLISMTNELIKIQSNRNTLLLPNSLKIKISELFQFNQNFENEMGNVIFAILDNINNISKETLESYKNIANNADTAKRSLIAAATVTAIISVAIFIALTMTGGASAFGIIPLIILFVGLLGLTPMFAIAGGRYETRKDKINDINRSIEKVCSQDAFTSNIVFSEQEVLNDATILSGKGLLGRDELKLLFFSNAQSSIDSDVQNNYSSIPKI